MIDLLCSWTPSQSSPSCCYFWNWNVRCPHPCAWKHGSCQIFAGDWHNPLTCKICTFFLCPTILTSCTTWPLLLALVLSLLGVHNLGLAPFLKSCNSDMHAQPCPELWCHGQDSQCWGVPGVRRVRARCAPRVRCLLLPASSFQSCVVTKLQESDFILFCFFSTKPFWKFAEVSGFDERLGFQPLGSLYCWCCFVLQLPSSPLVSLGAACSPACSSWTSAGHGECTRCGAWSFPFLSTRSACKECSKPEGYKRKRPVGRSETGKGKHLVSLEKKHVKYRICSFRRRLWDFWPVYVLCFSGIVQ